MRSDMSKVIVERPRPGSRSRTDGKFRQTLKAAAQDAMLGKDLDGVDELSNVVGMQKLHKDTRSFNEYLQPLRRYVISQIGRLWDDVYSEICEHLNRNSTVHDHIFTHLFSYVERHTYVDTDGSICVHTDRGTGWTKEGRILVDNHYCDTYVHPVTGILTKPDTKTYTQKRNAARKQRQLEDRRKRRVINDRLMFERDEDTGLWFRLDLEPAKTAWEKVSLTDREIIYRNFKYFVFTCRQKYGVEAWPVGTRRSASKKDIKDHGLNLP